MTLTEDLTEVYKAEGLEAALARFRELRERYHGHGAYDFSENALNELGYGLLGVEKHAAAIEILRLNAEQFPGSSGAWDSLADAYMRAGQTERAIVFYQKSLEIDPGNDNAVEKLRQLQK